MSDDRYFVDFATTIVDTSQKVLPQDGYLAYNQAYWNTSVRVTKNQTLRIRTHCSLWRNHTKGCRRSASTATSPIGAASKQLPRWREHGSTTRRSNRAIGTSPTRGPPIRFSLPAGSSCTRARVSSTTYDLDPRFRSDTTQTRTLPILSLDTGLIFERDTGWFGRAAQQTLEPRLFYAYIPFRDQSNLPNFDSALADLNYAQLFTENIYSGSDHFEPIN